MQVPCFPEPKIDGEAALFLPLNRSEIS